MDRYNSFEHACHNENVCKILNTQKGNEDWVITTAFYAALHFLRHRLFPLEYTAEGETIKVTTFNKYCISRNIHGRKQSVFKTLVNQYCPESISVDYNRMLDASYTARYNQYKFSRKVADTVVNRLSNIKDYSIKSNS